MGVGFCVFVCFGWVLINNLRGVVVYCCLFVQILLCLLLGIVG